MGYCGAEVVMNLGSCCCDGCNGSSCREKSSWKGSCNTFFYASWRWNFHDHVSRLVEAWDVFQRLLTTYVVSWNAMMTWHTWHWCWLIWVWCGEKWTMPITGIAPLNALIKCYANSGNSFMPWSFWQKCWVRRWK